jgi:hypothetical protein
MLGSFGPLSLVRGLPTASFLLLFLLLAEDTEEYAAFLMTVRFPSSFHFQVHHFGGWFFTTAFCLCHLVCVSVSLIVAVPGGAFTVSVMALLQW